MGTRATRRLFCEPLENRLCMAGNVLVSVTDGALSVRGDAQSNLVEIEQLSPAGSQDPWPGFRYAIIGRQGTLINGTPIDPITHQSRVIVEGVKDGVDVLLAQGDDILKVTRPGSRASLPGIVNINTGDGGDNATLFLANHKQVNIQTGGDGDNLSMSGCVVNALNIQTDWSPSPPPGAAKSYADGADRVFVDYLTANGPVSVSTGGKADQVTLVFLKLQSSLVVDTGGGDDRCGIGERSAGAFASQSSVTVRTSSGNDSIGVRAPTGGDFLVHSGDGNDDVEIEVGGDTAIDSFILWMGPGDDSLTIKPSKGASAKLDGGLGVDSITGEADADFESLVITNFES